MAVSKVPSDAELEQLVRETQKRHGPPCSVAMLATPARSTFDRLTAREDVRGTTVATLMKRLHEVVLTANSVRHHRSGECKCPR